MKKSKSYSIILLLSIFLFANYIFMILYGYFTTNYIPESDFMKGFHQAFIYKLGLSHSYEYHKSQYAQFLGKITIPFFLSLLFLISTLVKKYRLIQFSVILMLIYSLLKLNVIGIIIGITILVFIERESFKNHILNKEVKMVNEATQEE